MKVNRLEVPVLNFWVAKSQGLGPIVDGRGDGSVSVVNGASGSPEPYQPTTDWSQAGPILADHWYDLETVMLEWLGPSWSHMKEFRENPLLWLMRAFVAVNFGDEVEAWPPDAESD